MTTLQNKYRPTKWHHVIGQGSIPRSVSEALDKKGNRAFLFTGPSGVGKTTLARLIASALRCKPANVTEIDAASHSGVDSARQLVAGMRYSALGKNKTSVTIIDECHALSKSAWQALLKAVEEPAKDHYWVFCTTESTKVPKTIVTRCLSYALKDVGYDELRKYIGHVAEEEGSEVLPEVLDLVAEEARGSVRQSLSLLATVMHEAIDEDAARQLFCSASNDSSVYGLCRELARDNPNWKILSGILTDLKGTAPEGVRRQVLYYFAAIVLKERSPDSSSRSVLTIEAFSEPLPEGESTLAPIVLAVLRSIL